jgi:multicomponent Na+:H+ antiporter subunit F
MGTLVMLLSVVLGAEILIILGAVIVRPQVFDRIIGVGMVGTKATVLLAFTGMLFERADMFADLALTYAMLNFIVTLAVAKYFSRREVVP